MHDYIVGASEALAAIARRFVSEPSRILPMSVNLLGVTPLDFAHQDAPSSLRQIVENAGFSVQSCWAMGDDLSSLSGAAEASVNLVVSAVGLSAAKVLQARFGTPYVIGCPIGSFRETVFSSLKQGSTLNAMLNSKGSDSRIVLIGEPVTMGSLAASIYMDCGMLPKVLCPLEQCEDVYSPNITEIVGEENAESQLQNAEVVIADPLYRPICSPDVQFVPLPHEAFSGRIFQKTMPNLFTINARSLLEGVKL